MGRAGGTQVAAVPRTRASNRSASPASRDPSPTKTPSARGGSSSPSAALARGSPGVRRRRTSNNCERSASPGVQTRSQADGEPLEMLAGDGVTPKNQSFDTLWGGVEAMLQPPQIEGGEPPAKLMETPATRPCFGHIMAPTRRRKRDIVRPFLIKGLMSGVIYMMGEAIACGLLCRKGVYGFYPRAFIKYSVLHSALVGALANGPMLQLFFMSVDYLVNFKSRVLNVVSKVFIDQVVWGCFWNWCYILLMNIATDSPGFGYVGEGLGDVWHVKLQRGFKSAFWKATDARLHLHLLAEGVKMLPMDILCYAVVPMHLRPLWVAAVDTLWVTILSQYD